MWSNSEYGLASLDIFSTILPVFTDSCARWSPSDREASVVGTSTTLHAKPAFINELATSY